MKSPGGRASSPETEPWYRHPWPWAIIVLLGSAVVGSFLSAYLAVSHPEVILDRSDEPATTAHGQADPHG
jgi:hypothetical protein